MQTRLTLAVSRPNETLVPLLKNSAEFLLAIKEEEKKKMKTKEEEEEKEREKEKEKKRRR